MITNGLLLIVFTITWSQLSKYIKSFNAGFDGESDQSFWMFSYDFKSQKKDDYVPDTKNFTRRKRYKNRLIFILYINVFILFYLTNSFLSQLLILITE
ncbi:MAG: hypothetical protein VWZ84_02460 [Pelagibacteraceae bacterium]|jgi:hypothetical protein